MTNPLLAYNGVLCCKNVTARCEVPGDIRYELFESFLTAKLVHLHGLRQWPTGREHDWNGLQPLLHVEMHGRLGKRRKITD